MHFPPGVIVDFAVAVVLLAVALVAAGVDPAAGEAARAVVTMAR